MLELALIVIAVLVAAIAGGVWAVRMERKAPTSFTRRVPEGELAWWAQLPTETQEEMDAAALDVGEQADLDARADAAEAAEFLAHRVQTNTLFHP
nr:hypothetical protein OH837_49160 [Streptomyces canus]